MNASNASFASQSRAYARGGEMGMSIRDRNAEITSKRAAGATYTALAREYGLSAQRVRQICLTSEKDEQSTDLPTRAHNALCRALGFKPTPERLAQLTLDELLSIPCLGKVGLQEVRAWMQEAGCCLRGSAPHRCQACLHWTEKDQAEGYEAARTVSLGFVAGVCGSQKFVDLSEFSGDLRVDGLGYTDYEGYKASNETGPDFGCIHWEERL